jgi:uncharacterized protein (TIGR02118 family)
MEVDSTVDRECTLSHAGTGGEQSAGLIPKSGSANNAGLGRSHDNNRRKNPMAKVIVLYKKPKSAEAFDKHYAAVHIPLAKKIPGLKKYDTSTGAVGTPAGPSEVHLVVTLSFDSLPDLRAGMGSAEGKAAAGDLANFADGGAELYLFDTKEV